MQDAGTTETWPDKCTGHISAQRVDLVRGMTQGPKFIDTIVNTYDGLRYRVNCIFEKLGAPQPARRGSPRP